MPDTEIVAASDVAVELGVVVDIAVPVDAGVLGPVAADIAGLEVRPEAQAVLRDRDFVVAHRVAVPLEVRVAVQVVEQADRPVVAAADIAALAHELVVPGPVQAV